MLPVMRAFSFLQFFNYSLSHFCDSSRHHYQFMVPFISKTFVWENNVHDTSSMNRRVWVKHTSQLLDSGLNYFMFFFALCDERETSCSLAIEAKVLCIWLEQHYSFILLCEESQRVSVSFKIPTCKALICTIKADEMILPLYNFQDFLPVLLGWVNSSWIVSTHVHDDYWVTWSFVQIFQQSIVSKGLGLWIVVSITLPLESAFSCNVSVNRPGLVWNEYHCIFFRIPLLQEFKAESNGTGSWKRLCSHYSSVFIGLISFSIS